jgi:pimeloyl-ACP methyl ester carboxylesterase
MTSLSAVNATGRQFTYRSVDRAGHRLSVRDYPGAEPAVILLHGFPDNQDLYDRLLPYLGARRVVTFDFIGWGDSDKPANHRYTAAGQTADIDAVTTGLGLERVVVVAHDASGPPAIDWSRQHPDQIEMLVLLNTYYGWTARLRRPPAIALYSTPLLRSLGRLAATRSSRFDRWLFAWQVGRFIRDPAVRADLVSTLYAKFPAARPAFFSLNDDLLPTVVANRRHIDVLRRFDRPVRIIFGANDRYLNPAVARSFRRIFTRSELHLIPDAGHYVQVDEPARVAELIMARSTT